MIINSTQIIAQCQKLGALSSNQANLTQADFLTFANLVMAGLTAELIKAREEHLIYRDRIPVVAGQDTYRLPYRSIGGAIRHLWFEDSAGARSVLSPQYEENLENWSSTDTGTPAAFYIMGNSIVLLPKPNTAGTLVVSYPFNPNQLVEATTTQTISAVNGAEVTLLNMPSNFTNGALFDFIDHRSGNGIVYYDLPGTISGNNIAFPQALPGAIPGNYIALANQSPVPMVPEVLHPLLLEMTVLRVAEARSDAQRIKVAMAKIEEAREAAQVLLNNRVVSKPPVVGGGNPLLPRRPF